MTRQTEYLYLHFQKCNDPAIICHQRPCGTKSFHSGNVLLGDQPVIFRPFSVASLGSKGTLSLSLSPESNLFWKSFKLCFLGSLQPAVKGEWMFCLFAKSRAIPKRSCTFLSRDGAGHSEQFVNVFLEQILNDDIEFC